MQIPRLSSRLRASLPRHNKSAADLSLEELFHIRAQQLAERRQDQADSSSSSFPSSAAAAARFRLITATLGDWKAAPKAARDSFDVYIHAASKLVGGEASSGEVAEVAAATWHALHDMPALTQHDIRRKGAAAAELQRALQALQPVLGSHVATEGAVRSFLPQYAALLQWHQKLLVSSSTTTKSTTTTAAAVSMSTASLPLQHKQSNNNRDNNDFQLPWTNEDEAVLATCGLSLNHPASALLLNREAPGTHAHGEHHQRRDHTAAALMASPETVAAVEAEVFGGKKALKINEAAGARWLSKWCASVQGINTTSGDGGGGASSSSANDTIDDSVATSVALMLLSDSISDDALAAELFDLLGEAVFEHIESLLHQRRSLTTNLRSMISTMREAEASDAAGDGGGGGGGAGRGPSYGTGVTVMSESEKIALKVERKADRRRAKQQAIIAGASGNGGFQQDSDVEWLSLYGIGVLIEEEREIEDASI